MVNSLLTNVLLAFIFLVSIFENKFRLKQSFLNVSYSKKIHIPVQVAFVIFIPLFLSALFYLMNAPIHVTVATIYFVLSANLLMLAMWISYGLKRIFKFLLFLLIGAVILLRWYSSNDFSHNLFVALIILWLGPFLSSLPHFLTKKVFAVISIVWLLYDIVYVWITGAAHRVSISTILDEPEKFRLALVVIDESVGLADLFWAVLLISILKETRHKILAITLLVGSNLALIMYANATLSFSAFPLLVLWVPLGLFVLLLEKKRSLSQEAIAQPLS